MKAKFLCVAMAAAALASCSKNEVVEMPESRAITFGETFVGNSTRADYTNEALPESFKVWGQYDKDGQKVNIFKEEVITKDTDGKYAQAEDATIHYWIPNKDYTFAAIVTGKTPAFTFTEAGKLTFNDYVVNASNQEDLLYATATQNGNNTAAVKFDFGHLLSKVNFTYQATSLDAAYTMTVSNVKFYGMNSKGNFEGENWNATTSEAIVDGAAFAMSDVTAVNGTTKTEETDFVYILPQTSPEGTTLSLKAVITDASGTEVKTINGTVDLKSQTWAKSNTYTYNIKIDPELNQITFDTPEISNDFTAGQADEQTATNQPAA